MRKLILIPFFVLLSCNPQEPELPSRQSDEEPDASLFPTSQK